MLQLLLGGFEWWWCTQRSRKWVIGVDSA